MERIASASSSGRKRDIMMSIEEREGADAGAGGGRGRWLHIPATPQADIWPDLARIGKIPFVSQVCCRFFSAFFSTEKYMHSINVEKIKQ